VAIPLLGVDAFTSTAFRGNPAAVCLLDERADDAWMQSLAAEMNLSETAFVVPDGEYFELRWFTPTTEVELCGHATLASAHALWELERLPADQPAVFVTRWKGTLTAARVGASIALDFPAAISALCDPPDGLASALGVEVVTTASNGLNHIAELHDADAVRSAAPDFGALLDVDVEGVSITAASDDPAFDYVNRYFTPRYGIDEDPATGAAHTALAPYWAEKLDKSELRALQVSRRSGELRVEVHGDRVTLIGDAVTVWRGELA